MLIANTSALPKLIPSLFVAAACVEIWIVELEFKVFDLEPATDLFTVARTFTLCPA